MSQAPRVSVLMPAHNAATFVEEAGRRVLGQDHPADRLHLIAVDDGSTDGPLALLERLAAEHPARVTVLTQPNRGQVAAIEAAAERADGDLIAMIDADDVWPADKIGRQVALLDVRPEVGLVYTDMCVIDGAGRVIEDSWMHPST